MNSVNVVSDENFLIPSQYLRWHPSYRYAIHTTLFGSSSDSAYCEVHSAKSFWLHDCSVWNTCTSYKYALFTTETNKKRGNILQYLKQFFPKSWAPFSLFHFIFEYRWIYTYQNKIKTIQNTSSKLFWA